MQLLQLPSQAICCKSLENIFAFILALMYVYLVFVIFCLCAFLFVLECSWNATIGGF